MKLIKILAATMAVLGITALDCTVDWFGKNSMILVNRRDASGLECSVFERYCQSELFWINEDCLYWKDHYATLEEAADPYNYNNWWIKRTDTANSVNKSADCSIFMQTFYEQDLADVKSMLSIPYPTQSNEAYEIMMQSIKGELWETFYKPDFQFYTLASHMAPRSGTFGKHYLDNRQVEMYCTDNCTRFNINISDEGYVNPDTPRELSQDEIDFYTRNKHYYNLLVYGIV